MEKWGNKINLQSGTQKKEEGQNKKSRRVVKQTKNYHIKLSSRLIWRNNRQEQTNSVKYQRQ